MRRFPKPPALLPRFLALCFRPESWVQTAQYPTVFTLVPLVLAILLGAAMGLDLRGLAAYRFSAISPINIRPPVIRLWSPRATARCKSREAKRTDPFELPGPPGARKDQRFPDDPAGKTTPEAIKESGFLVNKDQVMVVSEGCR